MVGYGYGYGMEWDMRLHLRGIFMGKEAWRCGSRALFTAVVKHHHSGSWAFRVRRR
jgi:hypothetical protein